MLHIIGHVRKLVQEDRHPHLVWFCPCALFIVIAKLNLIGNCFRLNLNDNEKSSERDMGILGMNTLVPAFCPLTILA